MDNNNVYLTKASLGELQKVLSKLSEGKIINGLDMDFTYAVNKVLESELDSWKPRKLSKLPEREGKRIRIPQINKEYKEKVNQIIADKNLDWDFAIISMSKKYLNNI